MKFRAYFCSYLILGIVLLSFTTKWYDSLIISLLVLLVTMMLYKTGRGIVLMETAATLYVFTCLFMPLVGFRYFSFNNPIARLWVRYMPIKEDVYFDYALPAIALFCFAITLPSFKRNLPDTGIKMKEKIVKIRQVLTNGPNKGLQIMVTGIIVSVFNRFLPGAFSYFAVLLFFASFAGLLYVYFSPAFKYKSVVVVLFALFILGNAIQSGMFTIVAYMSITIFSFFQVGRRTSMLTKVLVMAAGMFFLVIIQNLKDSYRLQTWRGSYKGNKLELFSNLFTDNVQKGTGLLNDKSMFPVYARTNQGFNIAVVMRTIPRVKKFDNGNRLLTVLASAFVPRLLWPDKPEAGGKFNMKYYAGTNIVGWSTNVGPVGEAYGSFGVVGGVVYMFFLGLLLRWIYLQVFRFSEKTPLLICWLPVIFYEVTSSAETDTLQIVNSIIKSAFFIWLLLKFNPQWFGIAKAKIKKRLVRRSSLPA